MQNLEANDLAQMASGYKAVVEEPIFRYTCWNKKTGELISSIT
jgi:hypothetical protein